MNEFDFITQYLKRQHRDVDVVLGIGDDAAIIRPRTGFDLCVSSDMLLANRHFFADVAAADLAHKVLAVNLSDMAAMGAIPRWVVLSVALPELQTAWLTAFCDAWFALCAQYGVTLIGGDTTQGALAFNVTIMGEVPQGQALRRDAAQMGDDVWVSGRVGLAAAALQHLQGRLALPPMVLAECEGALLRPTPRVALGQMLLPIAHAAQDVSDGLAQDLGHILQASQVGATIEVDCLPTLPALQTVLPQAWQELALSGGDDYELVFTAAAQHREQIEHIGQSLGVPVSRIGCITADKSLRLIHADGSPFFLSKQGFDHFG